MVCARNALHAMNNENHLSYHFICGKNSMRKLHRNVFQRKTKVAALLLALLLTLANQTPVSALTSISWTNVPMMVGSEGTTVFTGIAEFTVSSGVLTVKLTNNSARLLHNWEVWTGLTWDVDGATLTPLNATAQSLRDSDTGSPLPSDLDDFWAFRDNLNGLGLHGIGAVGGEPEIFGKPDLFSRQNGELTSGPSGSTPNGVDYGIVSPNTLVDDFGNQRPLVRNMATFTFNIGGNPDALSITNVTPLFGSDANSGIPIPEPTTLVLLGSGLLSFACLDQFRRRRRKTKA